jgi:hypothetical protein
MDRERLRWKASVTAARVLSEHGIVSLPVDPIALAAKVGIQVTAKPVSARGVSLYCFVSTTGDPATERGELTIRAGEVRLDPRRLRGPDTAERPATAAR